VTTSEMKLMPLIGMAFQSLTDNFPEQIKVVVQF